MPIGGVQFQQAHRWVSDIGLGYHVGLDGLSLVLCGLVAFVAPWCLAFGALGRQAAAAGTSRCRCCSCPR